ncbi:MAG: glycogen synthase GlgA, partial [Clostridia bacterium]|nr:glycogen synthase GlgA [Clostridia bacterium]
KSVVYLGSEAAPFIATGGLADVMGSLPKAISANGNYDVTCILPLYSAIKKEFRDKFEFVTSFYVKLSWRNQYAGVFRYVYEGVTYYFIDNEYYFAREGRIYGFYDDGERFAFFSKAALDLIATLRIYPDVVHANDWQTAAAIVYLKGMYYFDENFRKIKTVFTIHNIEYQGQFGMETYGDLFGFDESLREYIEYGGCVNLMKAAIEMSDRVTTVSPTYAEEIKQSYFAHGLEDIINRNAHKLSGILNGIDYSFYDPETDTHIEKNYSSVDKSGKAECKAALQRLLNLPVRSDVPVVAMITRLISHKGVDLVKAVLEQFIDEDVQFVLLGTGETQYEDYFRYIGNAYSSKCRVIIAFNQDLSRKIYAGSDIFLMPSKMEPCGLSQMIASRYGSVSVVRETGGSHDSIKAFYAGAGNGFTFHDYNPYDMLYVLRAAAYIYKNKETWNKVVDNAMTTDFSWKIQAGKYENLYNN